MAEHYRFFGGTPEDPRQYNQTEFAEVMERIFKNGIFPGAGSELKVEPTDPARMAVRVAPGQAWLRGYWYKNDDWKEIDLPPADPNYPRIHRIVLRLDTVNERKIIATVKIGTPQAIPSVPELERNDQYWELSLATVYVAASVTSVTANDITDDRYTESCCGVAVPRDIHFARMENKPIRMEVVSSFPSSPQPGQVIFHSGAGKFYGYANGEWV
mgnify:CR=1 FL=1